jgi:hypothetical protein
MGASLEKSLPPYWGLILSQGGFQWSASQDSLTIIGKTYSSSSLVLKGIRVTTVAKHYETLKEPWTHYKLSDEDEKRIIKALLYATTKVLPNYAGPDTIEEAFASTITAGIHKNDINSLDLPPEFLHKADLEAYLRNGSQSDDGLQFRNALRFHYTYFTTADGRLGIGDLGLKNGDEICVLFGGRVLYIIRPLDSHFKLVGECYVHGYMNGEVMDLWKDGHLRLSGLTCGRCQIGRYKEDLYY